jgi:YbgC/YbaW family acyl-CoA thioester hydrolase
MHAMSAPVFQTHVTVRSYELDSFGHLNHAVFLSYFEHARFEALRTGGFEPGELERRGEGVHVVRVEVDYRKEARLGRELLLRTRAEGGRNTSFTVLQTAVDPLDPEQVFAEARVVLVWIDARGRPTRVPDDVREALGL